MSVSLWFLLQLNMTFHLFIVALAGAGAAVIAMVRPQSSEAWFFTLPVETIICLKYPKSVGIICILASFKKGEGVNGQIIK